MKNLKLGAHALMLIECAAPFLAAGAPWEPCKEAASHGVLPEQRQQIQVGLEAMFSLISFSFDKC